MKTTLRLAAVAAAIFAGALASGCSTTGPGSSNTYSFEPRYDFTGVKTYKWIAARPTYRQDPLIEANVRYLADAALQGKGLVATDGKADVQISIGYAFETGSYYYGYDLRALSLTVSRSDDGQLLWRGLATGSLKADAPSGDLRGAVQTMLANFPPTAPAASR